MILKGNITINGRFYREGSYIPWYKVYPFFILHVGVIGSFTFAMAYMPETTSASSIGFLYVFGAFAALIYLLFYNILFGFDEIKWMIINGLLGAYGIYTVIGAALSNIGRSIEQYPIYIHAIPFLFYVLYTFLVHQAVLDIARSRESKVRKHISDIVYVIISLALYTSMVVFGAS